MSKVSGIYKIQSKIKPERIYIGSTAYEVMRTMFNKNHRGLIGKCCLGKKENAYGFIWKYKNKESN